MFKKQHLALAIAATLAAGASQAALETSVTLKNETAYMVKDGLRTGEITSDSDTTGEGKGVYKFENTAKIFLNDELENGMSWHGELNIVRDTKAINDYQGHENYTQRDWLRELYVDTTAGDWDVRIGKQQVVWGTADGIKLLDVVNPTDWSELNQNAPADARIPVWMVNAEKYLDNGANIQLIASQAQANKIAGLNPSSDSNAPFIMKGVDTITGKVNGFYNIGKDFGSVAYAFEMGAYAGGFTGFGVSAGAGAEGSLYANGDALTVGAFGSGSGKTTLDGTIVSAGATTNLTDSDDLSATNPNTMFDYMLSTNLGTFSDFKSMDTVWRKKDVDNLDGNIGGRYKFTTDNGTNVSFNYLYRYDSNPMVDIHWEKTDGTRLYHNFVAATSGYKGCLSTATSGCSGFDGGATGSDTANLVFEEKLNRIHTIGGSFDSAIETAALGPVVVRGEWIYEKDVVSPIIDLGKLSYGDLVGALNMEKGDWFKYVIGADVTVATDMMVSGQFIQFRNLDYVDTTSTGITNTSYARYTGDMASMSITNGMQKAEENKNFYSLFLTKPFGDSGEGRWGNIFIFEEGGGKWNRFDVEYGFDDQLIGTFEVNKYFGDNNTMFGQFENASNVQIGVKYLLQ